MNEDEREVSKRPCHVPAPRSKLLDDLGVEFDSVQTGHFHDSADTVDEAHSAIRQCLDVAQIEPVSPWPRE